MLLMKPTISLHNSTRKMKRASISAAYFVLLLGISLSTQVVQAQRHISPPNGGNGVPGPFIHSFIIEWEAVPGAIGYDYVLSDNPLCFEGCPGDTRSAFVTGTVAEEYNLQEGVWYFWITRVYFTETEVTEWSPISSFLAETPDISEQLVTVAPHPVTDRILIHVDWAANPTARYLTFILYDVLGQKLIGPVRFQQASPRLETFEILAGGLAAGIYIGQFVFEGNLNNPNNTVAQTIVIL